MADSRGTRLPNAPLSFCTAENRDKSAVFRANLHIWGEKWRPAPRSTWMSVVGRVPVAVSCSEKLSEKITLSLKNGEKASVVLKGAALGKESDVRAAVTVERCHPDRWKGREGMAAVIRVKIPVPWGIKEREFFTEDGQPADVSKFYEAFNGSYGQYYWLQNIWMSTENKDRFQMAVNYADGLQEVTVPVSFKAAMGGILAPGGGRKEGGRRMMKTAVLICWMACSGPGAFAGDGGHDQNVPVEVGLRSMEISCRESGGEDEQALPAVKLSFALNFGVFEPFDLNGNGHVGDQSLEAEDSTGRNLGAVTFDVGNLHTWKRGKRKGTVFKGGMPGISVSGGRMDTAARHVPPSRGA